MKNKGIPFIEQHIEKFVLGAAGAVFFSVIAWQVLGTHNNVKLDGRDSAPGAIDQALAQRTQALADKLEQPAAPLDEKLGERLKPDAPKYAAKLGAPVAPKGDLPRIEPSLASMLQSEGATSGQPFHIPNFDALAMRSTIQVSDTLDATVIEQQADIKKMFVSASGPFDITWTVPSATVDLKQMRAELDSAVDGAQIPKFWFRSTLFVIDIAFERERHLDNGSWGESTLVPVLPGQFSFRPEIAKGADASLRDAAFNYLTDKTAQRHILQPDFYPTKRSNFSAATLLSEDGVASTQGEDPEIRRMKKKASRLAIEAKRFKDELEELGGPLEETPKDDKKKDDAQKGSGGAAGNGGGSGGGGASRPGGGLGGASGGSMSGGKRGAGDEATKERRIKLTKTLKDKERDLAAAEKALADKLGSVEASANASKVKDTASSDLATANSLVVWAHDIGVKAGEQYRYRAVAKVYNPFFTNGALLVDGQKKYGDPFTLDTRASDWSAPFRVSPPVAFFVVDAQAGEGRLGLGQATVEVFKYYDGQRRLERFTIQPGDAIGAGRTRDGVEFDTGFYLVDVYADPSIERAGTDRRVSAVAVVQNAVGDRYEIRVPKDELTQPLRLTFEDELELSKAEESAAKDAKDASGKGGKDSGKDAPKTPNAPKGGPKGGGNNPAAPR